MRRSKLGLAADQPAPRPAGSAILWRAVSTGHDLYRFWLRGPGTGYAWQDMTGWTGDAEWIWWTTSSDVGPNVIGVEAKAGSRPAGRPDQTAVYYTVRAAEKRDHYQVLGIASDAAPEEIRSAYRSLAMRQHPDRCPDLKKRWCEERFLEIREAYEILIDADKRLLYDRARTCIGRSSPQANRSSIITGLVPTPSDQQRCGSSVVWTAQAADPKGGPIHYRFWLKGPATADAWQDMTGWTGSRLWTWHPAPADIGNNTIKAEVRGAGAEGPDGCDDWDTADYIINREIISTGPSNWQKALLAIIIIIMLWSFYGSMSRDMPPGETRLSSGHSGQMIAGSTVDQQGSEGFDAERTASLIVRPLPAINGLHPSSASPKEADSNAAGTADANDPEGELFYSFLLRGPSGDEIWKIRQDWSAGDAGTREPSAADRGEDEIEVQDGGEDALDTKEYDAEMISSYTIAASEDAPAASTASSSALMKGSSPSKKTTLPSIMPIDPLHQLAKFSSSPSSLIPSQEVFGRQVDRPASFTPQEIAAALDREIQAHQKLLLDEGSP